MANVRCPMCSKLNPPEAEVCAYCGARIKPLRMSPSSQPGGEASPGDEPDWLKELRTDRPGAPTGGGAPGQASDASEGDSEVPDWLSRIRDRARSETSSSSDLFGEDKEEEADWLKEGQGDAPSDQGLDDWLSRIPGGETAKSGEAMPPAQPKQPGDLPVAGSSGSGLEMSDWLRELSDEDAGQAQPGAENIPAFDLGPSTGADAGEDDWMSKLSSWQSGFSEEESGSTPPSQTAQPGASQPASSEAGGEYDWLSGLGAESETTSGFDQELDSGTGLTSFLTGLEAPSEERPPAKDEPPTVFSEEGGFEWGAPETPMAHEKPSSGFGLTGFLSQLEEPEAEPDQTPPAGELREDVFTGWDQPAETAGAKSGGDLPDWISGGPLSEPIESAPQAGEPRVPDWLKGLEDETTVQPVEAAPAESGPEAFASGESGVPDWLRGVDSEPASEAVAPFDAGLSELPAWLGSDAETPAQQQEQPFVTPEEQPQAGKSDLPAWLFEEETAGPPAGEPASTTAEPTAQMPAFTGAEEENLPAAADMPDWLSQDFASSESTSTAAEKMPMAEETPAAAPAEADAGLPDWFASFDQSEIEKTQPSRVTGGLKPPIGQPPSMPPSDEEPSLAAEPAEEAEGPDWLRDFQGLKEEETGETISPLLSSARALEAAGKEGDQPFSADLPEWLNEDDAVLRAEVESQQAEGLPADILQQPPEAAGEQLAQAELPDWVREMRPLESILPGEVPVSETDQRVEKAGPLAGMRGVLPVEESASRYRKPPVYSVKLHVTEKQRSQAALLESILAQESQSLLIPPARVAGPGALIRVLLAVFLLIALAFPVVFEVGLLAVPTPERFPAENQMFEKINANLQPTASGPVLLAIEYEPGLSGEMRMASNALVAQLVEKNARIVLVSTGPAGPALGQQLLDDVSEDYSQRVNLGYLPGGTISLVGFASQPWWTAPATLEGQPAWGTDALLKDVRNLSDFSQVIVLTDRAEVGRAWVEQVQPQLGDVPLFMVASAQAAPLLQPYVESGQIAGMTSGMLGGAMYAQLAGQSGGWALRYLSAYQIGIVLAFTIVLFGGLVSAVMGLVKRGDKEEE